MWTLHKQQVRAQLLSQCLCYSAIIQQNNYLIFCVTKVIVLCEYIVLIFLIIEFKKVLTEKIARSINIVVLIQFNITQHGNRSQMQN